MINTNNPPPSLQLYRRGTNTGKWYVAFRYLGKKYQRCTGSLDREEAYSIALEIYNCITQGDVEGSKLYGGAAATQELPKTPARYRDWDHMESEVRRGIGRRWTPGRVEYRLQHWRSMAVFWGKPYYRLITTDINQESVDNFYDWAMEKYAPRTVQLFMVELKLTCEANGISLDLPKVHIEQQPFVAPDPAIMEAIWDDREELKDAPRRMLMLCMGAGLRRNEAANARWSWVDIRNSRLAVTPCQTFRTKSGRGRRVPMFGQCLKELISLKREEEGPSDLVLGGNQKPSAHYNYTATRLIRYLKSKGLYGVGPGGGGALHTLRKYYGSVIVTKTGSIYKAQKALGHASFLTTEQIYTDLISTMEDDYSQVF